jgi:carbamoyltransferase
MANIAFYGSHNAAVAVEENGKLITVIEVERFLSEKNAGYSQYLVSYTRPYLLKHILKFIEDEYGISEYDTCYYLNSDTLEGGTKVHYEKLIPAKEYKNQLHHLSHAACGLYQSDYRDALIISFDGGGNDGFFNVYHG